MTYLLFNYDIMTLSHFQGPDREISGMIKYKLDKISMIKQRTKHHFISQKSICFPKMREGPTQKRMGIKKPYLME